ncbi:MAG: CDP-glucose 4,6-dehydratase [Reichenbachiella sp.]
MELTTPLAKSYKNKKVFVTGHTGFKGAWLISILHLFGAKIKGYALTAETNSLYNEINGDQLCQSIIADIRDKETLQKTISEFQPDYIFHLAAQPLVLDSYEDPIYSYEVNVMGTAHLLQSCRSLDKLCSVVVVTTDKVYLNLENQKAFKEEDPLGGLDPYSGSKACAEILTNSFRHSFFQGQSVRIASARAGNVIGGGDYAKNRIIPDIVRALSSDKKITIRNPKAIRPWQHVLDCLNGYLMLGARNFEDESFYTTKEQAWNFGPNIDDSMTVLDLAKLVIGIWESGAYEIQHNEKAHHEAGHLQLDNTKSNTNLGWHPKWDTNISIEKSIFWYKNRPLKDLTIPQITEFYSSK